MNAVGTLSNGPAVCRSRGHCRRRCSTSRPRPDCFMGCTPPHVGHTHTTPDANTLPCT